VSVHNVSELHSMNKLEQLWISYLDDEANHHFLFVLPDDAPGNLLAAAT
jgi:hypothetical protein